MNTLNPKVDEYLSKVEKWRKESEKLRMIVLDCRLTEELKWGCPCYTFQKKNIVIIHGFKEYCALLFIKGALLKDARGILIRQTKNVQAARQIRFAHIREIEALAPVLKAYIYEAIEAEKSGLKADFKEKNELVFPEEFQNKFWGIDAGAAKSLCALFFSTQTIQNSGGKSGKIHAANSQRKRTL